MTPWGLKSLATCYCSINQSSKQNMFLNENIDNKEYNKDT